LKVPAFYERDGQGFVATDTIVSPWNPKMQNGVALAGLLAFELEAQPTIAPMSFARFHLDILRPVPLGHVDIVTRIVRDGRRMQMLEADLVADGAVMARAYASRLRLDESPALAAVPPPVGPDGLRPREARGRSVGTLFDLRPIPGRGWDQPGPGAAWLSCVSEVVAGEAASPFVTAAMACDFGSGLSTVLTRGAYSFANIDISMNLIRQPQGAWMYMECETLTHGGGRALVNTTLSDMDGEFARAHQTLFVDRMQAPPAPVRPSPALAEAAS
jgi:hypothetical protein